MTSRKISQYDPITNVQSDDLLVVVDVHDTSMASSGTTKKMTLAQAGGVGAADYAPTGLTGAAAASRYVGGTASGAPVSGTFAVGDFVIDQSGKVWVCTAAGTPGTWVSAGAQLDGVAADIQPDGVQAAGAKGQAADAKHVHPRQPYQFLPEAYGAKGDGQQALVTVTNGSGVINTTPVGAPASAPTVSNAATGGTIAAGTYQVKVTYVNQYGETVASASASTTTAGSTSTITINSPGAWMNATGWYAYVTQAGGSTYYRQQAAGSPTPIQVALVLTAPPTTSGANPPGADTSAAQVFTSTAVDGGKNIMICGAAGSPGGPVIDTIASVQSPTQATLATQTATVSVAGCAMVFSSDDRVAIDNCIQAAAAYAIANDYLCQVLFRDRIYGLGTGLFQSTAINTTANNPASTGYNAQVRIPVPASILSGQTPKLEVQLLGPGDNAHSRFWVSWLPNLAGCTFMSYSSGPNSADPTYGQQSIIGGPQSGTGANASVGFANVKAVIKGIHVVQPGYSNSIGIDLQWIAGCIIRGRSGVYAPGAGAGVNPCLNWVNDAFWQNNKIGRCMRLPNEGNNEEILVESFAGEGLNHLIDCQSDHARIYRLESDSTFHGIVFTNGDANAHNLSVAQWSFSNMVGAALKVAGGSHFTIDVVMDGEQSSIGFDVQDPGNDLFGRIFWNDPFRSPAVPTVQGAANVRIINCQLAAGHMASPPAVPASGAASAPVYRDAAVVVHTGAGVTVSAIAINGTATGLTMAASSSLALPFIPSGATVTPTYAGGTPTWDWWLA